MKIPAHLIIAIAILFSCESKDIDMTALITQTYDSLKAMEYGADDYGMRKYVIAFLRKGPNRDLSPEKANELQAAHLKNIGAMADAGKLALAGPFYGSGELRGLYFFNVESLEEAEALTKSDPAIQAGSLKMELKEWYGSAALLAVGDIHKTLAKIDI
ncbi:MAG: hypothetical protein HQ556_00975 [Candidatus Marinimicrobia bacterium]|nr:hypothetical protein [Candidatus Neomarinimicrobiota bacterium]